MYQGCTMKWTRKDVLTYAALYGEVQTNDQYGNNHGKPADLCNRLVEEELMRRVGYATYVITDKGREAAVGFK